jgi:hypothetical protein
MNTVPDAEKSDDPRRKKVGIGRLKKTILSSIVKVTQSFN